jgi:hypothetical protein
MSSEFEERLHDLLAVPDADTVFVGGLRSKLIERSKVKTFRRFSPRLVWGIAIFLVLLIIGLLVFSPQIVEAMRRLLGYIPGVGYVEQGPALRVLSAPVTVQKEGLAVTIEKGAADSQHTVLLAQVEGYSQERYKAQNGVQTCKEIPQLVTADGTVQGMVQVNGSYDENNVLVRYEFQAMPANRLDATLEIPCLLFDENYKDWSIPLHFQVADETNQVFPVIELPTSLPTQPVPTSVSTPASESAPAGFSIVLKSVAELKDGYVLSGSYQWSDTHIDQSAVNVPDPTITDAKGQDVPFQPVDTGPSADSRPQQIPFTYQIMGKNFAWPLKIIVNAISVVQPGQGTFQFDPGQNPQVGQTWNVNVDVPVGQHLIHVETIQLTGGAPNALDMIGYEFTMTSDPAVASALVDDMKPIIVCKSDCGGGGGGGQDFGVSGLDSATGPFVDGWEAKGYSPAGIKTFVISDVSVFFKGPWQVSWQPSSP